MQERTYQPKTSEEILVAEAIRLQMQLIASPQQPGLDVRYNVGYIDAVCYAQAITDPFSDDPADRKLYRTELHAGTIHARRAAWLTYIRKVALDLMQHGETVKSSTPMDFSTSSFDGGNAA